MITRSYFKRLMQMAGLMFLLATAACQLVPEDTFLNNGVFLNEQFARGQTGNWLTETDTRGQTIIINESLVIVVNEPQSVQYSALLDPTFSDFALEVDATLLEGSLNSTHGVLFRMQLDQSAYRFDITPNGLFTIEKHYGDGRWERLTDDWVESSAIVQGVGQTNRLRIEAVESQLNFYINNQAVHSLVDESFRGGRIALDAGTFNQGGVRVAFDNLVVTEP